MRPIVDSRISLVEGNWLASCLCGKLNKYSFKASAVSMLEKGSCRYCKKNYKNVKDKVTNIYKNNAGKWCSVCSGCKTEQVYTRKDHAKQSAIADWQCKTCAQSLKKFSNNKSVGAMTCFYNRFKKSAFNRQINWEVTLEDVSRLFNGFCSLTGWEISLMGPRPTASIDRIDSNKGYKEGNVRWVHKMVNMCKNKYSEIDFTNMCLAIAANTKK